LSEESLFREVDEEVRQEQFKKLWDRYGNIVVAICVVIVVGVAGGKGWQYWQVKQAETAGETYFAAAKLADADKLDDALAQFAAISHSGYALLARMREAGILAASGKVDEAVKAYDALAADSSVDQPMRDLAQVRAAYALADTASPADLKQRIGKFDQQDNPWRHAAREIQAIALWRTADYQSCGEIVTAILADPQTPPGLRQRAKSLSDLLEPLLPRK
jgi:hypothetical protein